MEDDAGRPKIPAELWTAARRLGDDSDPPSKPGDVVRQALRDYLAKHGVEVDA